MIATKLVKKAWSKKIGIFGLLLISCKIITSVKYKVFHYVVPDTEDVPD